MKLRERKEREQTGKERKGKKRKERKGKGKGRKGKEHKLTCRMYATYIRNSLSREEVNGDSKVP
jgi:hypothetical protein